MADALKAEGNKLFAAKDFKGAVEKFSAAIELDSENHILYSNRSGAYASLKDWDQALADADRTTKIKPDWSKGWGRKGTALHGQGDLVQAHDAFEEALKLDSNNAQAKSGFEAVKKAIDLEAAEDGAQPDLGNIFGDPNMYQKLANNPKTSSFLADPSFMANLQRLKSDPNSMGELLGKDPRVIQAMGVLMGIDMSMGMPPEGSTGGPPMGAASRDTEMPDAPPSQSKEQPKKAPEPEPEPEPEDEEAIAKKKAKAEADKEKALGTENYKKRNFDQAIVHYGKAWDIHQDITYLTNKSAAEFEKGDYDASIKSCQQAIEEGRVVLADFKLIAKAFGRIGSAYEKKGDLGLAIDNYQRSLTEHRTPDILNKLRAVEKAKIKAEKDGYVDATKADEARELGNKHFKEANWPGAVEAYTEMTKRAPEDPRGYSNRAAALIKLMTFPSAVADCDEAIKRDPKFIRAYLRKAQALFVMKEYSRCGDVCEEALLADETGSNRREIEQQQQKALQAQYAGQAGESEEQTMERIQKDPEIMAILQDPIMQSILQQAKGDPAALQEHMRNPGVRTKIQKLVAAGVIRTR